MTAPVADMRARAARSARRQRASRSALPVHLPGAAEFSDEPDLQSVHWLLSTLKGMAWLWRDLRNATRIDKQWGRRRGAGDWSLLYLAYLVSGFVDIEPWYQRIRDDRRLWRLCGFTAVPAYQTTWERFAELEQFAPAFEEAAGKVIRRARRHDPEVGAWLHGDGTECETHAAPVHDCRDDEHCPTRGHRNRNERRRLPRLPTESATAIRHAKAELAEEDEDGVVTVDRAQPAPVERVRVDRARGGVRFYAGGHWWYSRDPDAGTRAYTLNGRTLRAWHGFYHHKLIDHYTGCPVTVLIHSAAESEAVAYPRLLERAIENTGLVPAAVTLDRGFATRAIYRLHSEMGIGTIAPYRRLSPHDPEQAAGTDTYDEHGVPRCRHCGGETAFVRFAHEPRPRLWVRCLLPSADGCTREQTISCSHEWRRLIPIWRTTPVYAALRGWHQTTEQVHRAWRDRYRSGPKSLAQRPKRIGLGVHQLRASAALLVEWLRLSFRQGWLGGRPRRVEPIPTEGGRIERAIAGRRRRLGITRTVPATPPAAAPPAAAAPTAAATGPPTATGPPRTTGPPVRPFAPPAGNQDEDYPF